jgi:hypothetical protein
MNQFVLGVEDRLIVLRDRYLGRSICIRMRILRHGGIHTAINSGNIAIGAGRGLSWAAIVAGRCREETRFDRDLWSL